MLNRRYACSFGFAPSCQPSWQAIALRGLLCEQLQFADHEILEMEPRKELLKESEGIGVESTQNEMRPAAADVVQVRKAAEAVVCMYVNKYVASISQSAAGHIPGTLSQPRVETIATFVHGSCASPSR